MEVGHVLVVPLLVMVGGVGVVGEVAEAVAALDVKMLVDHVSVVIWKLVVGIICVVMTDVSLLIKAVVLNVLKGVVAGIFVGGGSSVRKM